MIALVATILCASMQGATLQEIEAKKKAEEAKREQQLKNVVKNKYGVVYDYQQVVTELRKDISTKQKDWIMKLIALENANNEYVEQELKGHVIPDGVILFGILSDDFEYCKEATEAYSKEYDYRQEKGWFSETKHYYADKCILGGVRQIARNYSSIYDKDQYKESELSDSFNEQKYNEKKRNL